MIIRYYWKKYATALHGFTSRDCLVPNFHGGTLVQAEDEDFIGLRFSSTSFPQRRLLSRF